MYYHYKNNVHVLSSNDEYSKLMVSSYSLKLKSNLNCPSFFKCLNSFSDNIFVCDFENGDYFWLHKIMIPEKKLVKEQILYLFYSKMNLQLLVIVIYKGGYAMLRDILYLIVGLIAGGIIGFLVARKQMKKYLKDNPPINEEMIKVMMSSMGRTPTKKQINQMMKQMNKYM